MKSFYRIEHKEDRIGCYQHITIFEEFGTDANERHPMPDADTLLCYSWIKTTGGTAGRFEMICGEGHRFGFNSLEQLKAWFYNEYMLLELEYKDFVVSLYEVPEILEGNTQCMMSAIYHTNEYLKKEFKPTEILL